MSDTKWNNVVFGAPGSGSSFKTWDEDLAFHTLIFSTTRTGRSSLLEQEASRRGISYEELLREMEPTDEEKEIMRLREVEVKHKEDARMQAVRDAYWSATDHNSLEFCAIYDGLSNFCGLNDPTVAQCKIVFDMLDGVTVGKGVTWGFSDTEVRDDICEFIRENSEKIQHALTQIPG